MSNSDYVTNAAWIRQVGRPDLIDEVANEYERPAAAGMQSFWAPATSARWPRTSRGWRSRDLLAHRAMERRAG